MPKLSGVFDIFDELDLIPIDKICAWIKPAPDNTYIGNYLANRILYPQAIPVSKADLVIEEAILREAIKAQPTFFDKLGKKIVIPVEFAQRLPNLSSLVLIFADSLNPSENMQVVLEDKGKREVVGTMIIPRFEWKSKLEFSVDSKKFQLRQGEVLVIPCSKSRCHLNFGKKIYEVNGGSLGLFVDGRRK